jgi:peptide/nickel transport system ATP-binding protein
LPSLPGQMPGVTAMAGLPGCRFAPRCPRHDATCANALPPHRTVSPGHQVRCAAACSGAEIPPGADLTWRVARPRADAAMVLELEDVSLRYTARAGLFGGSHFVDAVREVSLRVAPGEFVGLVGESGSGKSSVARLVLGLARPTSGRILLDDDPPGRHVQIVFQDPRSALNPRRRVLSLITQALEISGQRVNAPERYRRARELLHDTGLPVECMQSVPSQLSGGQRQRVNIARALCVTPRLLVADEIVSGLDVSVQAQILNLLLALGHELGLSLLFISHDLAAVRYLCTRVAVMHRGEIVESGETDEVFGSPKHAYTRRLLDAVPARWERGEWNG